jgi:hypothetical protein
MEVTIKKESEALGVSPGTLIRLCEYFGFSIFDFVNGWDISENAELKEELILFLNENGAFIKRYNDDYFEPKSPEIISHAIRRNVSVLDVYLKKTYPRNYINNKFFQTRKSFVYVSSYEIDYDMELLVSDESENLTPVRWHLGLKQQQIVSGLKRLTAKKETKIWR